MTNMKALIKQLIPPMAIQIFAKLRRGQLRSRRYSSFADATLACRNGAYQSNALVRVVVEKNSIYEQNLKSNPVLDLSNLGALLSLGIANLNGRLNVLDFGGAGGHHYTIANIAFGVDHPVRWNVVETAAMAMAAQT